MMRVLVVVAAGVLSCAPAQAVERLTTPEVVEKAEPCVYRVRVRGTLTREAGGPKTGPIERKAFDSTGT